MKPQKIVLRSDWLRRAGSMQTVWFSSLTDTNSIWTLCVCHVTENLMSNDQALSELHAVKWRTSRWWWGTVWYHSNGAMKLNSVPTNWNTNEAAYHSWSTESSSSSSSSHDRSHDHFEPSQLLAVSQYQGHDHRHGRKKFHPNITDKMLIYSITAHKYKHEVLLLHSRTVRHLSHTLSTQWEQTAQQFSVFSEETGEAAGSNSGSVTQCVHLLSLHQFVTHTNNESAPDSSNITETRSLISGRWSRVDKLWVFSSKRAELSSLLVKYQTTFSSRLNSMGTKHNCQQQKMKHNNIVLTGTFFWSF